VIENFCRRTLYKPTETSLVSKRRPSPFPTYSIFSTSGRFDFLLLVKYLRAPVLFNIAAKVRKSKCVRSIINSHLSLLFSSFLSLLLDFFSPRFAFPPFRPFLSFCPKSSLSRRGSVMWLKMRETRARCVRLGRAEFLREKAAYCFQRFLAIAILSVRPSHE